MIRAATAEQRAFAAARVREQVRRLMAQERGGAREALAILERSRRELVVALSDGGTEFDVTRSNQMIAAIDREIRRLRADLTRSMAQSGQRAIETGRMHLDEQARVVVDIPETSLVGVDPTLLRFAEDNATDLVGQISEDLRSRLNVVMRGAAPGAATAEDVRRQIGVILTEADRPTGVFGKIAVQVERVHRTETARLYEGAKRVREREVAERVPYVMLRRWIAALDGRTRIAHRLMNGATVPVGEHFNFGAGPTWSKVSWEEAGRQGGTQGTKVTGPQDGVLTARDAVNCRCTVGLVRGERKEGAR